MSVSIRLAVLFNFALSCSFAMAADHTEVIVFTKNGKKTPVTFEYNSYSDGYPGEVLVLISRDFDDFERSVINSLTDAQYTSSARIADASMAYNCHAYMLDMTGYWIDNPAPFLTTPWQIVLTSYSPATGSTTASIVLHQVYGGGYEPAHGSRWMSEFVPDDDDPNGGGQTSYYTESKLGRAGVYKLGANAIWNAYSIERDRYYKKPTP